MKQRILVLMLALVIGIPFAFAQETDKAEEEKVAAATTETAPAPAEEKPKVETPLEKASKMIAQAQKAVKRMKDFTAIFSKKEWKKGKQLDKEVTDMKWRKHPRSVYMKWIGKVDKDQEMIWVKGKNDNKLKAHQGGFLKLINVNLDPNGSMAMKKSRHPVMEAGFDHTVDLIAKDMKLCTKNPDWGCVVKDIGMQKVNGVKSYCYEAETPKAEHKEFYAYKAHICMDVKLKLPNKVQIWDKEDGKIRLVENYSYKKVKVNVGLSDKDFDPDNEEYKF